MGACGNSLDIYRISHLGCAWHLLSRVYVYPRQNIKVTLANQDMTSITNETCHLTSQRDWPWTQKGKAKLTPFVPQHRHGYKRPRKTARPSIRAIEQPHPGDNDVTNPPPPTVVEVRTLQNCSIHVEPYSPHPTSSPHTLPAEYPYHGSATTSPLDFCSYV